MVIELLIATTNRGKFAEVESSLKHVPLKMIPLQSLENFPAVVEESATYEEKLLNVLKDCNENRPAARFVCVLALCAPKSQGPKQLIICESCEGRIAFSLKGQNGFGYDPLFF